MLPRLLYIADVAVEASYYGSALVYRLLERYPVEQLRIVEAGLSVSSADRRLRAVRYQECLPRWPRLAHTRFSRLYWSFLLLSADARARRLMRLVREFQPEAILSVTHGHSFITAARLARRIHVPLHLICHDEWFVHPLFCDAACKDRIFGKVYRAAASRLCVSPFMAEVYQMRYHARGSVLYPSRAYDAPVFDEPPGRLAPAGREFVCAYAGSFTPRYAAALELLAEHLIPVGGRLLIFGPIDAAQAKSMGLSSPNIQLGGLLTSPSLIETLRKRADALFVPMSFSPDDRANMEISFPSKLTDYTAVGLPLLIYGPEYCSAVRWARANAPVAEVVTAEGGDELSGSLRRLVSDPGYRMQLARSALLAGKRYFSYEAAYQVLSDALGAGA